MDGRRAEASGPAAETVAGRAGGRPPGPAELAAQAEPVAPEPPGALEAAAAAIDAADERDGLNVAPDDPHRLARLHLALHHGHADGPTLACRGGAFFAWEGADWREAADRIDRDLYGTARAELERLNRGALEDYKALPADVRAGRPSPTVRKIGRRLVADIRLALGSLVPIPDGPGAPCWLGGEGPWPAREVLAFPDALVHLPGLADGRDDCRIAPTPRFFSTRRLPFAFDPGAPPPARWHAFLDQVLGEDREARDLLQEWFGYCLTGDTSHQKILLLLGPTRAGKGTIARVLRGLLGPGGAVGIGFADLAVRFGAEPLIGKGVAVLGDARLSGRSDQAVVVERLLTISGEDEVTVDRKHRAPWTGTLPTRLMLLANELPELRDAALALASRLLIVELKESFVGREDPGLADKLLAERPGILLWAVEGWRRLRGRGRFEPARSGAGAMEAIRGLSSPVSAFVDSCCELGPEGRVPVDRLYAAYKGWCIQQGLRASSIAQFGRQLRAAVPGVGHGRPRAEGGKKLPQYTGLGLRAEGASDA